MIIYFIMGAIFFPKIIFTDLHKLFALQMILLLSYYYIFKYGKAFAMIHDVFLILNQGQNPHDVHLDKIDKYFCLSNSHKQFVSQHHNIPMEKIVMTSNGLDFDRFKNKFLILVNNSFSSLY